MADFGSSLKKAREAKGISLDKIAGETRISTRFLRAIEEEEFHVLPGGVFNRGFVRTYAERVGLDPDQTVADYERLAEYREPAEPVQAADAPANKIERHLYTAAVGALVLLIAIFYLVTRSSGTTDEPASPALSATTPTPQPPQPPPPAEAPAVAVPEVQPLSIEIAVHEQTWVLLTTDGSAATELLLEPGMTRRFTANRSIDITIGNAGGLTLKVNDKPVRRPLGRSGQVRQFIITHENVDDIIG